MKKLRSYILVSILIVFIFLILILKYWPDKYTHIIFCDVGQGDAILITSGFTQVLIDAGLGEEASQCLGDYMPFWDKQLELVLITHADSDHIGGFPKISENYQIKKIFLPQVGDRSSVFKDLKKSVLKEKAHLEWVGVANFGHKIVISDGVVAQILWPILNSRSKSGIHLAWTKQESEKVLEDIFVSLEKREKEDIDKNNGSVVLLLSVGKIEFLLTGDLEVSGEQSLLSKGLIKGAHILKAGHHGSKTSSSDAFIERIQPEKVVISSGKNNSYGHPSPEVLERFEEIGVEILRTDELGSIELISDGESYWLAK
ncbi:MAG: MBL fold metallo-hydrolase [Patescibacteria group bacterium]